MPPQATWSTSADELLQLFRDALEALIPIANRARMPWREPAAYDDWDQICESIYRSIVIRSIEHATEMGSYSPFLEYGHRVDSYANSSFITQLNSKGTQAFICFETDIKPFDVCLFATLDNQSKVIGTSRSPTESVNFIFAQRRAQMLEFFDHLDVCL